MKAADIQAALQSAFQQNGTPFSPAGHWFFTETSDASQPKFSSRLLENTAELNAMANIVTNTAKQYGKVTVITSEQTNSEDIFRQDFSVWIFWKESPENEKQSADTLFAKLIASRRFEAIQFIPPSTETPEINNTNGDTPISDDHSSKPNIFIEKKKRDSTQSDRAKVALGFGGAASALSVALIAVTATVLWSGLLTGEAGSIAAIVSAGILLMVAAYLFIHGGIMCRNEQKYSAIPSSSP